MDASIGQACEAQVGSLLNYTVSSFAGI